MSRQTGQTGQPRQTKKVVIVGGGTAGWITANAIAAETRLASEGGIRIVLVESPNIPTIGVGEGTWPSMRMTLNRIGLSEDRMVRACNASFKQGTRFFGWSCGDDADEYIHPFSLPVEYASINPAMHWLAGLRPSKEHGRNTAGEMQPDCEPKPRSRKLAKNDTTPFSRFVTPQATVIERGLAPKQAATPQYAFAFNYGYHLDAGRFAALLCRHAVTELGVTHLKGNVVEIENRPDGDIDGVLLDTGERVGGDLFVDCTGQRSLLLGQHHGIGFTSVRDLLFNDTALVMQIPYARPDDAIASATSATAQRAGWIWDIGLTNRRGVGYVHSGAHVEGDEALDTLVRYAARTSAGLDVDTLDVRTITFDPGYRDTFWHRNCVAVGLSAGFVEPLEASALALIEQSAWAIATQLPRDRRIMDVVASRFNAKMHYHWERIVEFLKLHYAVGGRGEPYWRDHRAPGSSPPSLIDKLTLWQQQPPWHDDAPRIDELFPSASYQYVLYGLGFRPSYHGDARGYASRTREQADRAFHDTRAKAQRAVQLLPTNRALLCRIAERAGQDTGHG